MTRAEGTDVQKLLTNRLLTADPTTGILGDICREGRTIHVSRSTGRIIVIKETTEEDLVELGAGKSKPNIIDLRGKTVLPGFVDTHVHLFLHPYVETSWEDQVTRESTAERTIRAVTHAKSTLLAGYTTVRDLGTEGAEDSDIAIRQCISSSIIPGPRYFCASRAIVATGSYGPKNQQRPYLTEVDGKAGADSASGQVEECVGVVRRHIGAGADWIKIYADYPARILSSASPRFASTSLPLFTQKELEAMIETAHRLGVKVASHCVNPETISMLVAAGVDTLEHGTRMSEDNLSLLAQTNTVWNPTFAAYFSHQYPGSRPWDSLRGIFKKAVEMGVLIGTGGDTGVFPHGRNCLEMQLMHRLGMSWHGVIRAVTWVGWLSTRTMFWDSKEGKSELESYVRGEWENKRLGDNDVAVGCLFPGFAADIIATDGDLEEDFENSISPSSILFVMKGAIVYKQDGISLCM